LPHVPQLFWLFVVSTQAPLQLVRPAMHWQLPVVHVRFAVVSQTVPHVPQLVLLLVRSTQMPLQDV
jgi:hypothetical protein